VLLRRRKSPTFWTDEQLAAQIRAVYRGGRGFVPEAHGEVDLAAVVFHQDPALFPRKMIRIAGRELGGFVPYCLYGLWWNDYLASSVQMGDEPFDTFRTYSGHDSEAEARTAAKAWLQEEGDRDVKDLSFAELPAFARSMVHYVLRRGPGYFG
jgi:hypothetical protein